MMPPYDAGKAAAFADADDVDEFLAFKDIDQNPVAGLYRRVFSLLRIIDFNRQTGINHLIMSVQWPGMPQSMVLEVIETLAREVFPKVRSA